MAALSVRSNRPSEQSQDAGRSPQINNHRQTNAVNNLKSTIAKDAVNHHQINNHLKSSNQRCQSNTATNHDNIDPIQNRKKNSNVHILPIDCYC
jgi:hypothetical protein